MSAPPAAATRPPAGLGYVQRRLLSRAGCLLIVLLGKLGALLVVCCGLCGLGMFGLSSGTEFSPDTFQTREFTYYSIPYLNIQLTAVTRSDVTGSLAQHLKSAKLIVPPQPATGRWDVISDNFRRSDYEYDARLLHGYLQAMDREGNTVWFAWTQDHPQLAAIFWPEVARAAQRRLYILAPAMFELASRAEEPEAFRRDLYAHLNEQYRSLAGLSQETGRHERAVLLYTDALFYDPADRRTLRGRATSHEALGESATAKADLEEAREME